jgi:hypothetical protein
VDGDGGVAAVGEAVGRRRGLRALGGGAGGVGALVLVPVGEQVGGGGHGGGVGGPLHVPLLAEDVAAVDGDGDDGQDRDQGQGDQGDDLAGAVTGTTAPRHGTPLLGSSSTPA